MARSRYTHTDFIVFAGPGSQGKSIIGPLMQALRIPPLRWDKECQRAHNLTYADLWSQFMATSKLPKSPDRCSVGGVCCRFRHESWLQQRAEVINANAQVVLEARDSSNRLRQDMTGTPNDLTRVLPHELVSVIASYICDLLHEDVLAGLVVPVQLQGVTPFVWLGPRRKRRRSYTPA